MRRNIQSLPYVACLLSLLLLITQWVSIAHAASMANTTQEGTTGQQARHATKRDRESKAEGQKFNNQLLAVAAISKDDAWAVGFVGNNSVFQCSDCRTLTQHWDGTSWRIVPSLNPSGRSDYFFAVTAINKNEVWAVGASNGSPLIEEWNGKRWQTSATASVAPSPDYLAYEVLKSVSAVSDKDIWAVGWSGTEPLVEHWNGASWQIIKVPDGYNLGYNSSYYPLDNTLTSVKALNANNVYISGPNLLEHWDGKNWHVLEHPAIDTPVLAALSSRDIWVSGNASFPAINSIARWNGQRWLFAGLPFDSEQNHYMKGILAIGVNDAWSVGFSEFIAKDCCTTHLTLIGHWNGQHWKCIPSPNPSPDEDTLYGIAASSAHDIWAVGYTSYHIAGSYQSSPGHTFIEHWDGASWKVVASPNL